MRTLGIGCACLFSLVLFAQSSGSGVPSTAAQVTFNKHILPILQQKCQSCHRPGEAAPMSFLSYQTTRPWARAMKTAVTTRKMPPGGLDPRYGDFLEDYTLTDKQIETIVNWADGGAVEGDPGDAPPPVRWVEGWRSKPDVVIEAPPFDVPATGWVENLDIILPTPFKRDAWVRTIEIRPGMPAVVHHAGVRFVPHRDGVEYGVPVWRDIKRDENGVHVPDQEKAALVSFCSDDSKKACPVDEKQFHGLNGGGGFDGFYRPGGTPLDYAYYGTAYLIPANSDIVINLHYNPNGRAVTDATKIGFTLAPEPARQLRMVALSPRGRGGPGDRDNGSNELTERNNAAERAWFRIPAGDPNWLAPPADMLFDADTELAVMSIHMHERGKDMTYTLLYPDGRTEVILNQPGYDFNWQMTYNLRNTIKIPKGSKLRVIAHYNNSASNRYNRNPNIDVYWGEQSWEEMMAPWVGLIVNRGVDLNKVLVRNPGDEKTFFARIGK
jgi:Copper type II ascorbate-dependent monooxygenase, C-terminal domain